MYNFNIYYIVHSNIIVLAVKTFTLCILTLWIHMILLNMELLGLPWLAVLMIQLYSVHSFTGRVS